MIIALALLACTGTQGADTAPPDSSLIGTGDGTPGSVDWTTVLSADDKLSDPRDLGFDLAGQLWVANREDDRTFIVTNPGQEDQVVDRRKDGYAEHFMEEVAAIAFERDNVGAFTEAGEWGSCGESDNTYNDQAPGNGFMGPVLWSADLEIFAEENPIGLGSHLDMNHESPFCVGMAWEADNVYWVFDGDRSSVVRYDFAADHDVGLDDHSDGVIYRFDEPEITRVEEAPGHMEIDRETGLLYVADTGGGRVLWFDTATGSSDGNLPRMEPGTTHERWTGASWGELVTGLDRPGGLALHDGRLYVGEYGTGVLHEFSLAGEAIRTLDTGLGEGVLHGIEVGPDGHLWIAEIATPSVRRVDP
jgi:hypothetical protein